MTNPPNEPTPETNKATCNICKGVGLVSNHPGIDEDCICQSEPNTPAPEVLKGNGLRPIKALSDTPETNAAVHTGWLRLEEAVSVAFARTLERRAIAAEKERDELREDIEWLHRNRLSASPEAIRAARLSPNQQNT